MYLLQLSTDSIFLTSMILLAPSGAQGITTLVLSYSLICLELKVFIFLAQVSQVRQSLKYFILIIIGFGFQVAFNDLVKDMMDSDIELMKKNPVA